MTQIGHTWWPKPTSSATSGTTTATFSTSSESAAMNCCGLSRLIRKLKRRSKMLRPSRQSSFQCRYDPLSYALNFDATGCGGGGLADEDYYKFYAFSSRFVATPRNDCQRLAKATASH